jgi:aryl-alcohol dehydrogenase-like predicted oxidoreductase
MKTVFVGQTGLRVSALTMGTMSFGGDANATMSKALYYAARDAGINHFDTANIYNKGESERMLGELTKGERDQLVIGTKVYFATGTGPNDRGSSRYHIRAAVEDSLRRLQTDRIDLLYLHRWDEETVLAETLRAVEDLCRAGKVLYPAVSNFAAWQTAKALGVQAQRSWTPLSAIQPMYNLVKRQAEVELLPMALAENLAVFPYSPLGGGLLTGKYGATARPASGRIVDSKMYLTRYGQEANFASAGAFTDFAQELGIHPVTLAIAWVRSHPAVTAPILGARNVDQLAPALAAAELELDSATRMKISDLSATPAPATDRREEQNADFLGAR